MDATGIVGDEQQRGAEQLAALRRQLEAVVDLREGVGYARLRLGERHLPGWRSESERRYSARRGELRDEVDHLAQALETAANGLRRTIAALTAQE